MKFAKLLHNPDAGKSEYSKKKLMSLIQLAGFECRHSSTKEDGWENMESEDFDLLIVAGGDGTVRKVAGELLEKTLLDKKLPIGLLPVGTANNIARTLGIEGQPKEIIGGWGENRKKFDVGRLYGLEDAQFFLESFGYGVFPRLMKAMKNYPRSGATEDRVKIALQVLHDIICTYEAKPCVITVDDAKYSGKFLLAEVMNIRSIGPNLHLAPSADPGDGELDVVLIPESQRDKFAKYVQDKIQGQDDPPFFNVIKTKKLVIKWDGAHVHVDDEIVKLDKFEEVKVEIKEGLLEFLLPKASN